MKMFEEHLLSASIYGGEKRAAEVLACLRPYYPPLHCELHYKTALELLVATILLSQNTAEQVNALTPALFSAYGGTAAYLQARRQDLARRIYPLAFFRHKARYIQESCRILEEHYEGELPRNGYDLTQLPGLSRKGANLIMGELFNEPIGIAVEIHTQRVANRLGWSDGRNVVKVENDLLQTIPPNLWLETGYLLQRHGRAQCHTHAPACATCPLNHLCPSRE